MLLKLFVIFMVCLIASSLQSCAQFNVGKVDVKKMTYKALRQHDCRVNEPNTFCDRGFSNEFEQYERLRARILNDKANSQDQDGLDNPNQNPLDIW